VFGTEVFFVWSVFFLPLKCTKLRPVDICGMRFTLANLISSNAVAYILDSPDDMVKKFCQKKNVVRGG
jgi:hypothetical protein